MLLTENQVLLMREVREREGATTQQLGAVTVHEDDEGQPTPFGEDAARKCMTRLADRGLVAGEGTGALRVWRLTDAGGQELDEADPPQPATPIASNDTRPYVVLEPAALCPGDLTTIAGILRGLTEGALPGFEGDLTGLIDACEHDARRDLLGKIEVRVARNSEHAARAVWKDVNADATETVTSELVTCPERMWQKVPVTLNVDRNVTIGAAAAA